LKLAGLDLSSVGRQLNAPAKLGVDTVPHIRESGKRGDVAPWSCESDIIIPTPRTPESKNDVQARHKRRTGPGEITVHWGMKTVDRPEPGLGYGKKSNKDESFEECYQAGMKLGIAQYVQSRGESIYQTVQMEPLGRSWVRGHALPEETKKPLFKGFGKELELDKIDAKESIFPLGVEPDTEHDKARYKRTHGAFDPGEAIKRNYVWPDKVANDRNFSFGVTDVTQPGNINSGNGAKTALTMDLNEDKSFPCTRVVNRTSEDFRQVANDKLGTARNMLQGCPPVAPGHAYGLKSGIDVTHAGELMRGFYTSNEQRPDTDLGRCTVRGRRNFHTKRPFGVPSVRHDLVAPPHQKRSIASCTNFGDDHSAFNLIFPEKFGCRGVGDGEFFTRRPAEEIRAVLEGAGYKLEDQDFQMLWDNAVAAAGDEMQLVSLEVMLNILGQWMSMTGVKTQISQPSAGNDTLLPMPRLEQTARDEGPTLEATA